MACFLQVYFKDFYNQYKVSQKVCVWDRKSRPSAVERFGLEFRFRLEGFGLGPHLGLRV